jgi:hypothetical protein
MKGGSRIGCRPFLFLQQETARTHTPFPQNNQKEIAMRTKITLYGEIAGIIWMPAVECSKEFHLELVRIPRTSTTRTYPGIAPRSMEITCLRDALLHLINDGDFQSCTINWAELEISHYFGDESRGTRTVKVRTRVWGVRGQGENADCFA